MSVLKTVVRIMLSNSSYIWTLEMRASQHLPGRPQSPQTKPNKNMYFKDMKKKIITIFTYILSHL